MVCVCGKCVVCVCGTRCGDSQALRVVAVPDAAGGCMAR